MEKTLGPSVIDPQTFNSYRKDVMRGMAAKKYKVGIRDQDIYQIVNELASDLVPDKVSFPDDFKYNALVSFINTAATYNIVTERMKETFEDYNKRQTTKPDGATLLGQKKFIQTYALYVASQIGKSELFKAEEVDKSATILDADQTKFKKTEFNFETLDNEMFKQLIDTYTVNIIKNKNTWIKNGADFSVFTRAFYDLIDNKSQYEKDDGIYKEYLKILEENPFTIHGMTFKGFDTTSAVIQTIDPESLPKLEDVVAMTEAKEIIMQAIDNLLCYDQQEKKNCQDPFRKIYMVVGDSGCGKTILAEAGMRYFIEEAIRLGKKHRATKIVRNAFASTYQNETALRLARLFENEIYNEDSINFGYGPDLDATAKGRAEAEASHRGEDKAEAGVWFDYMSGSRMPKRGFWMLWFDTNYQIKDNAFLTRLGEPIIAVGPKTPDEMIKILKIELRDGFLPNKNYIKIKDEEWKEIGDVCSKFAIEEGLSGRDTHNACESLIMYANKFKMPPGFKEMKYKEQVEYKNKNQIYNPVTKDMLLDKVKTYVESKKKAKAREEREKIEHRVTEMTLSMQATKELKGSTAYRDLFCEIAADLLPAEFAEPVIRAVQSNIKFEKAGESEKKTN